MSGLNTPVRFDVTATGDQTIDALLQGSGWNTTNITYAFPINASSYVNYTTGSDDGDNNEPFNAFNAISAAQVDTALFAMEQDFGTAANDGFSIEGFTNLGFTAGAESEATIRIAQSSVPPTAWGYYPAATKTGGDIWFGTAYIGSVNDYRNPVAGNYAWHTMLHEIGHAMGLKHGHETFKFGALASDEDSLEFSIMTYRTYIGDNISGYNYTQFSAPQTFMMSDIAALQQIYGADFTTNGGNTTYSWSPDSGNTLVNGQIGIAAGDNTIFATIWDGGGIDTYNLSAYGSGVTVDLAPGGFSVFDVYQLASLGGGPNGGLARGNMFNALLYQGDVRSLIENAIGGAGADTLKGNQIANKLSGGEGGDTLLGQGGNDTILGQGGDDRIEIYYQDGADAVNGGDGTDFLLLSRFSANQALTLSIANSATVQVMADGTRIVNVERLEYYGGLLTDRVTGGVLNDTLYGNEGNDVLMGDGGNDLLQGNAGKDTVRGGLGNDRIEVYATDGADTIDGGAGIDHLLLSRFGSTTAFTVSLATPGVKQVLVDGTVILSIDTLEFYGGVEGDTITGGKLNDTLYGNEGDDAISGGAGADTLVGGIGSDTYYVTDLLDTLLETVNEGIDTVVASINYVLNGQDIENLTLTGTGNLRGTGNALANQIVGTSGNNIIDGGLAADRMSGGAGDDTYVVDNAGDLVIEAANGGNDRINSTVSYSLGGRVVENLTLTGSGNINATGNSLVNILVGNAGNNRIDGGLGADTMTGGAGNDTFVVNDTADIVREYLNGGTDTIFSSVSYSLGGRYVETLTLNGTGAINATGNNFDNTIAGNAASNTLRGLGGSDTFQFKTALGSSNVDTLSDFNVIDDTIQLAKTIFSAIVGTGVLSMTQFLSTTAGAAQTADNRIVYDSDSGNLFYDSDGNGATAGTRFAKLGAGLSLTNDDFLIIA